VHELRAVRLGRIDDDQHSGLPVKERVRVHTALERIVA
jgi:hypothetical protein